MKRIFKIFKIVLDKGSTNIILVSVKIKEFKVKRTSLNFKLNYHEYVIHEYLRRENWYELKTALKDHSNNWTNPDGSINQELAVKFIVDNFNLFSNETLFKDILKEARKHFNIHVDEPLFPLLDNNLKKQILDYEGKYDGFNIFKFDRIERLTEINNFFKKEVYAKLNKWEQHHNDLYFDIVKNGCSLDELLLFLENSMYDKNFSSKYISSLEFDVNNYKFHFSGITNMPTYMSTDFGYFDRIWPWSGYKSWTTLIILIIFIIIMCL